jgi:hypothetical protein
MCIQNVLAWVNNFPNLLIIRPSFNNLRPGAIDVKSDVGRVAPPRPLQNFPHDTERPN